MAGRILEYWSWVQRRRDELFVRSCSHVQEPGPESSNLRRLDGGELAVLDRFTPGVQRRFIIKAAIRTDRS